MNKTYESWRNESLYTRLLLGRLMGVAGMLFFVVLDSLAHPAESDSLLLLRVGSVGMVLATGMLDRTTFGKRNAHVVLLLMVWALTIPMVHMSVVLGGFASSYYIGIILIHCGAAAIFPLSLRVHLVGQIGTFTYYYGLTFASFGLQNFFPYGIETVFFQFWFFGLLDLAIFYYERIARERYVAHEELESSHEKLLQRDVMRTQYFLKRNTELRDLLDSSLHRAEDGEIQAQKDQQPVYEGLFAAVIRPVRKLRSVIYDFLDLAQLEAGKMEFRLFNFNLISLIQEVIENFRSRLEDNQITIKTSFPSLSVAIRSDPVRLKQVLSILLENLMRNATKGKITVSVNPGFTRDGQSLLVLIAAEGVGMAPEQRVRAFLPYHAADDTPSGIRLPIARMITRLLGGDIMVSGELGSGTTFSLEIPAEAKDASSPRH